MTSTVAAAVDAPSPSRERRGLERTNNFNLIRVIAAIVVIFDHSFRLVGQAPPLTGWLGYTDIGTIAVYTFFIMSGHLLTSSWAAHPRIVPFFVKRFMRIMPGLVFALLFGALLIGPLMTTLPLSQYIHDPQTSSYVSAEPRPLPRRLQPARRLRHRTQSLPRGQRVDLDALLRGHPLPHRPDHRRADAQALAGRRRGAAPRLRGAALVPPRPDDAGHLAALRPDVGLHPLLPGRRGALRLPRPHPDAPLDRTGAARRAWWSPSATPGRRG